MKAGAGTARHAHRAPAGSAPACPVFGGGEVSVRRPPAAGQSAAMSPVKAGSSAHARHRGASIMALAEREGNWWRRPRFCVNA